MGLLLAGCTARAATGPTTVSLRAGWNAVGLQGQRVTSVTGASGVTGMAVFAGGTYTTTAFSAQGLDGRRGLWLYAPAATTFTYAADDPEPPRLSLQAGWNLVSFTTATAVAGSAVQRDANVLPLFYQIDADNRQTPVDVSAGGTLQPGRAYWVYARAAASLTWTPGTADYRLETWAQVPNARHMTLGADGTLFVGTNTDSVYAVRPNRQVVRLLSGLNGPNGLAVDGDDLLVGEVHQVQRYRGLARNLTTTGTPQLVCRLTSERNHGMRLLRWGPDGALYIVSGYPGNVGAVEDPYGTILRLPRGSSTPAVYVRGIRNSMGLDWHPTTGQLWFSDNGRDNLGDDAPPEEVNRVEREGQHFGFPFRHGRDIVDPEMGSRMPPGLVVTPPAIELQAHVAPLGMRFYRGSLLPDRGRILLATHGSWNRSRPVGYEVLSLDPDTGDRRVLVGGWLGSDGRPTHRPVDVQEAPDGSVYISDDFAGTIFRLTYR